LANYPALTVAGVDPDLALASADDFSPTAADQETTSITIFFADRSRRDAARDALSRAYPAAVLTPREVDDEDWARRSQENLEPITVGKIRISPAASPQRREFSPQPPAPSPLEIVIQPSMGFGTGHHATTRLCLTALQTINLKGRTVLDVGTGSGILAIAAARLGARRAIGLDNDPDAVQAARANLAWNPDVKEVVFEVTDLVRLKPDTTGIHTADISVVSGFSRTVDVVTANLTGALLVRTADTLLNLVPPGGLVIVSGLLDTERGAVAEAFERARLVWEAHEDEWVGMIWKPHASPN
jgi:ribosomal protein L11 methyltransferase